jgi:transcriptional regulator with XRE-family HTH domain
MATVRASDGGQLGQAVREVRQRLGLSQAELAADSQVGRQWLVEFEAGAKRSAPLDMVFRVLRQLALEVTLDSTPPARPPMPIAPLTASQILAKYEQPHP